MINPVHTNVFYDFPLWIAAVLLHVSFVVWKPRIREWRHFECVLVLKNDQVRFTNGPEIIFNGRARGDPPR